jgi:hypothetical protein
MHIHLGPTALLIVQALLFGLVGVLPALSTMQLDEMERLLVDAVKDVVLSSGLSLKECAFHMRIDARQLQRQLAMEPNQYIALTKLFRLPFRFWLAFIPTLMFLLAKKRVLELAQDVEQALPRKVVTDALAK